MADRRAVSKGSPCMTSDAPQFDMIDLVELENDADDESTQRSFDSADSFSEIPQKPDKRLLELGLIGLSDVCINGKTQCTSADSVECSVFDSEEDDLKENDIFNFMESKAKPKLVSIGSSNSTSSTSDFENDRQNRKRSAVDGLLFEIYERYSSREIGRSIDSDNITECSTTSSSFYFASSLENDENREKLDKAYLVTKGIDDLERMVKELKRSSNMMSSKLVRLLKQRDRNAHKLQQNFDILTAILQAVSLKRRVDTRIRFSFIPSPGKKGFRQWHDAFKSIVRLPTGILQQWRKRTWISLAEYCLKDEDWNKIKHNCFNDRRNPDDDELDTQIVKDLHRTGCGWFFARDTEEQKASLKRVLLAYARWNKSVGYCQGFNVIAALILQVIEGSEEDALKVMIYLVDFILPRNYFANNLRALSADMAVLRELMSIKLPHLAKHLDDLQKESIRTQIQSPGDSSYEPPLVNVFTMQWFLTLFATCLPRETVLKIWDAVLLEGSEVLLRVALAIWAKLADYLDSTKTAADFYMTMGSLIRKMMDEGFMNSQKLMETVFSIAPFPYRKIVELREKFTYDIHPFSTFDNGSSDERPPGQQVVPDVTSDDEGNDSEVDTAVVGCLSFLPMGASESQSGNNSSECESAASKTDIAAATPGAVATDPESHSAFTKQRAEAEKRREKENLDLSHLQKQYMRMRKVQKKHMLVFNSFSNQSTKRKSVSKSRAINHLFIDVPNTERGQRKDKKDVAWNRYPLDSVIQDNSAISMHSATTVTVNRKEGKREKVSLSKTLEGAKAENLGYTPKDAGYSNSSECKSKIPVSGTAAIKESKQNSMARRFRESEETKTDSPYFKIDKNAMYPANFKPFPQRNHTSKTNFLFGAQMSPRTSEIKQ